MSNSLVRLNQAIKLIYYITMSTITITCTWGLNEKQTFNPKTRKEAYTIIDNADDSDLISLETDFGTYQSEKSKMDYKKFEQTLLGSEKFQLFIKNPFRFDCEI